MELGNYVEAELNKREMSKQMLHQLMQSAFPDDFNLAYNSFSNKLANNNLNAIELLQIASILDLKLDYLKELLTKHSGYEIRKSKTEIKDEKVSLEVKKLFEEHSPTLRQIYENGEASDVAEKSISKYLSLKFTKKHKNIYQLTVFHDGDGTDDDLAALEELDLNKRTIRVLGSCIPSDFDSSVIKQSINWHQKLNDIILKESGDYYTLFPVCITIPVMDVNVVTRGESVEVIKELMDLDFFDGALDDGSYY